MDADILSDYGLSYDPTPFCYASSPLNSALTFPATPAASYFMAVGLKKSYGAALAANNQHGAAISYALVNEMSGVRVYSAAAGLVSGIAAAAGAAATAASIFPYTVGIAAAAAEGLSISESTAYVALVSSTAPLTTALATAGAGAIVAIAVTIAIQAGMQAVNNETQIDELNLLGSTLASVQATQPDLSTFLNDDQGRYKLNAAFVIQTLPDTPATTPLPAHVTSTDPDLAVLPEGGTGSGVSSAQATFQDWNKNQVTITTWGGYFLQTTASVNGGPTDSSITPTIHYLDWSGNQMTASRRGASFLVLRNGSTQPSCPADSVTGLSTQSPDSCSSYLANVLQLLDKDGNKTAIRIGGVPVFTSPSRFSTPVNTLGTATITVASGAPLTDFRPVTSVLTPGGPPLPLPQDITVSNIDSNNLRVEFGSAQPHGDTVSFSATNGFGTVTQSVVFTSYSNQFQFTSIPTIVAASGDSVRYTVTTNGASSATITSTGLNQIGLTLTDNHDGTATIAGTVNWPSGGTSDSCQLTDIDGLCPINVTATNGAQTITSAISHTRTQQSISLDSHTDQNLGYLAPGSPVSVQLAALCAGCAVTYSGQLPAGLTLSKSTDGNGFATLTGTPQPGSEGDYSVMITFAAAFVDTMSLKLSIGAPQPPTFTSVPQAIFYLNQANSFTISAAGAPAPTLVAEFLPDWLSFQTQQQAGGVTGKLTGTPPVFSAAPFSLSFKATSTSGQTVQNFALFFRLVEGDMNTDGVANCSDYQMIKAFIIGFQHQPGYTVLADNNGDGLLNIEDLAGLGRLLPGNPVCH